MDELKACPFCGGSARDINQVIGHIILCRFCDARTGFYRTEEEAIEAWNRRVSDDER